MNNVVGGNGSAGILETMATVVTSGGRKECSVGGENVEVDETGLFDDGNHCMKDLRMKSVSYTNMEIGKEFLARDGVLINAGPLSVVLPSKRIAQDANEIFDGSKIVEVMKQVEKEERDGIVAGTAEGGIGIEVNAADEGEIYYRADEVKNSTGNRTVIVDGIELFFEFVMGEPTGFLL